MARVDITGANQFSAEEKITSQWFSVSVFNSASFNGTVVVQRRREGEPTAWRTVASYSGEKEETGIQAGTFYYRIGCTDFTAGTISAEISL